MSHGLCYGGGLLDHISSRRTLLKHNWSVARANNSHCANGCRYCRSRSIRSTRIRGCGYSKYSCRGRFCYGSNGRGDIRLRARYRGSVKRLGESRRCGSCGCSGHRYVTRFYFCNSRPVRYGSRPRNDRPNYYVAASSPGGAGSCRT